MLFEKWLVPDRVFPDFRAVTPELLCAGGIRFVFSDIDNTVATYDDPTPPPDVVRWIEELTAAGIRVVFVSNNDRARVEGFVEPIKARGYWKAGKPLVRVLRQAMRDAGAGAGESLLFGDQLLTDCAAGKRLGMPVWIVPPIKDKTTLFWRVKRAIEKPYMRIYEKKKRT